VALLVPYLFMTLQGTYPVLASTVVCPDLETRIPSAHSRLSYNNLRTWLEDARTLASAGIVIILVGNKKDLEDDREVTFIEASRFAQENSRHHPSHI